MRRNHLAGILLLSVFSWLVILYLFLIDRPTGKLHLLTPEESPNKLKELENQIQDEIKSNADFLDHFKKVIELQSAEEGFKETGEGENEENVIEDAVEKKLIELSSKEGVMAVLVFSCNRVTVKRCLDQLIRYRPSPEQFPVIVSQDCQHEPTASVIRSYKDQVFHILQPDQSEILVPPKEKKFRGYFKIARHYGWALNQVFYHYNFTNVIVIEDDLDISPDMFSYFLATLPLLYADPTLWCVSAWNDNGKVDLIDASKPDLLHRTDFFPGLGWMLTRNMWEELAPKWPQSYWDDWIRQPEQRKNRSCIRPEISRTRTFGKIGVSNGLFYEKHLKYIHLNDKSVDFSQHSLNYLLKDNYDENFVRNVYNSPVVSHIEVRSGVIVREGSVRIPYHNKLTYRAAAKSLGLMDDFRSGVPRTGYRGVVSFFYKGRRVYLAPTQRWKGYDPTWS